jgi:hypothetical protein
MSAGHPEFFLDFTSAAPPELPEWMPSGPLRLCIGYGDFVKKDKANTEMYPDYDVYLIYTYDKNHPNLDIPSNIDAIKRSSNPHRVICNVNLYDPQQVERFTEMFSKRMRLIVHHSNGPTIHPEAAAALLTNGGEITSPPFIGLDRVEHPFLPPYFVRQHRSTYMFRDQPRNEWGLTPYETTLQEKTLLDWADDLQMAEENPRLEKEWRDRYRASRKGGRFRTRRTKRRKRKFS